VCLHPQISGDSKYHKRSQAKADQKKDHQESPAQIHPWGSGLAHEVAGDGGAAGSLGKGRPEGVSQVRKQGEYGTQGQGSASNLLRILRS